MSGTTLSGAAPARYAAGLCEVAPGTYAWLAPNGGLGESNAGLVVGAGASMLVDTLWDHTLTAAMLQAIAPLLATAPLTRALNTHSDGDHWWGNAVLGADTQIVAGATAAAAMRDDVSPREVALLAGVFALGGRLPGGLGAPLREGAERFAPIDFGSGRLRYPDRVFHGRARFDVGGRELRAIEVGPAHTPGDTIVHVPDVGVVFAADVLFIGVAPIMWTGPVDNWIAATELLLGLDADVYVPGHGPVGTRADVERMRDYWVWVRDGAREQHRRGRPAAVAARELLATGAGAWRDWDEPERILISLDAIFRGLDGRSPVAPRGPARIRLMRQVAELGAERAR